MSSAKIIFRPTGDIIRKEAGQFYYVDRQNAIIKRFGHRVHLSQIETKVYEISELQSICIWDDENSKLILFVVLYEQDKLLQNKIIDRLRTKFLHTLPASCNPDIIQIIPSIPLTNNGKIDKECLIKITKLNKENCNMSLEETFLNLCSKYFGMSPNELDLRKKCSFFELGGNSILAIQIIAEFDSTVENNFSNVLMGLLLDRLTKFEDMRNFIRNSKGSKPLISEENTLNKRLKLTENDCSVNKNTADLKILWKYNMDACIDSTPVFFEHSRLGPLIAIGNHANIFLILNAVNGTVVSKTILSDAIEGSACISKDYAIIGCNNGFLYKINVENGQICWIFETKSSIKSTPILCCGNNIIFGSYDKHLYCINVNNAVLVWKLNISESIKSTVIVSNEVAFISSILGTCFCISVKQGTIIWKHEVKTAIFGAPCLLVNHNLILWADVKGHVHCFDKNSGDKLWQYEIHGCIYSSLCQFENKIIFGSNHNIYCIECTKVKCIEVFKINIGQTISSTPYSFSLVNKKYFVVAHNKGVVHLFDNEELCQTICLPGDIFSSPIVSGDKIYIGCRDNYIYCIQYAFKKNPK